MKVKMLKSEPGADVLPGERFRKGGIYDVPDKVGRKWVRRMIAEPVVVSGLATDDKPQESTKRAPHRAGRETKEE